MSRAVAGDVGDAVALPGDSQPAAERAAAWKFPNRGPPPRQLRRLKTWIYRGRLEAFTGQIFRD